MSAFFVGQRVRIVRPKHAHFVGREGRITAMFSERPSVDYVVNCDVQWDDPAPPWYLSYSHTSRLEPILPDGHRACDDDFKRDLDRLLERQRIVA